jgi:Ser/Thr protein kinase RdoA (MazF antagonist)
MRLLLEGRPGLNQYLVTRPWEADLTRHHVPAIQRARPLLKKLERQWGHGDWHPSNLTWTSTSSTADVAGVLDLGLANRTYAIHDLATAIERAGIDWLNLAGADEVHANLDAVDALLDGYETVRPLNSVEADVLPEILPVVHLEYALSEIEYFTDVVHSQTNADLAYDAYLIGHSRWFEGTNGATLLNYLRGRVNPKMLSY